MPYLIVIKHNHVINVLAGRPRRLLLELKTLFLNPIRQKHDRPLKRCANHLDIVSSGSNWLEMVWHDSGWHLETHYTIATMDVKQAKNFTV